MTTFPLTSSAIRGIKCEATSAAPTWRDAQLFSVDETPAEFSWEVAPETFSSEGWLSFDFMVDSPDALVFELRFYTDGNAEPCTLLFAGLPHAQARLRFKLCHTDQRQWMLGREGACLKRLCWGRAVAAEQVVRVCLSVSRKATGAVRWWQSPLHYTEREPELLSAPLLPKGMLIDELGQSTTREWSTKTPDFETMRQRLESQATRAFAWSSSFSKWGGDASRQWNATGFFRTEFYEKRWWLVDPDGHPFWSAGMDCVRADIAGVAAGLAAGIPKNFGDAETLNFLGANFERVFGKNWKQTWNALTPSLLREFGINTVGNWSDSAMASAARFPYVMPLPNFNATRSGTIFREFPDVFHPEFESDAKDFAQVLQSVRDDKALIGYFLMNEPTWGFAAQTPAEGMLTLTESAHSRDAFADWLAAKHGDNLAAAWAMPELTLAQIRNGRITRAFSAEARADLEEFSTTLCAKLFDTLSAACKAVAPHHLNLGARYYTVPPRWALLGMANAFDVFSINGYTKTAPAGGEEISRIAGKPVLIGEWHFGALDAGLPASGIGHVRDQEARGAAYRYYLEQSAAMPWCVGVHWFTLYDQSAIGRSDGEAYNIGFLDVCNRPYAPICEAAAASFARMYDVARGSAQPFDTPPEYLPMLFF